MGSSRRACFALAAALASSGCLSKAPPSPCAEAFVIYEVDGEWFAERVDNGTNIFGPGSEADATAACTEGDSGGVLTQPDVPRAPDLARTSP
jgi:hypothetical protein